MELQTVRTAAKAWLTLVGAGVVACAGLSGQAMRRPALSVAVPPPIVRRGPPTPAVAVANADAAPAKGTTGTTTLPALPIPAAAADAIALGEVGVVPARPFAMGRASSTDRARAMQCLTAAIYYEAASEPDAGQQAVAQVILNRVRHPAFPATVCGVVYQGSERTGCQFSFACDGAMSRIANGTAWARASRVAGMALAGYVYKGVGLATHYHTYAVTPAWNRALVMTDAVGAHFFHRWKGYWGTAAAFRQVYTGHEPVPGRHAAVELPLAPPLSASIASAPVTPITPVTNVQPAHAESGMAKIPTATAENLRDESQVLDRWKDSGKPLR